ncbi:MAG: hypothetical protein ACYTBJ_22680 [Planctomycetota bacterium]|jgi:hypothetical protein
MSRNTELSNAVIEAAKESDGRETLTCAEAFRLAERFDAGLNEIGRICNEQNIRISRCQLGCFQ